MRRVIGLTGSIGAGKSSVARLLGERGAIIIDADDLAREVVAPGTAGAKLIRTNWPEVVGDGDIVDRKALGRIVFGHPDARKVLEAIVHPLVRQLAIERISSHEHSNRPVFYMVPLLFEAAEVPDWLTPIVAVVAPDEVLLRRIMDRDDLTEAQARARIDAQLPQDIKRDRADVVINNSGSLTELDSEVSKAWIKLESLGAI